MSEFNERPTKAGERKPVAEPEIGYDWVPPDIRDCSGEARFHGKTGVNTGYYRRLDFLTRFIPISAEETRWHTRTQRESIP